MNIIFILMDDMGYKDLSCYGSGFYETPNLDKLAKEGMMFTDAYAACPVCSPTRASIMSGKYPARVGVTDWIGANARGRLIDAPYIRELPLSEKSLASALKDGGYKTWHIGKWHLGKFDYYPEKHGFDVNIAGSDWGHPFNGYFSPYGMETMSDGPDGEYLTDRLTAEAIKLIKNNDGSPFFMNFWHYAVHEPIQAPRHLIEKYEKKAAEMGIDKIDPFEEGDFHPSDDLKHIRIKRRLIQSDPKYAAIIENLDTNIGKLLDTLDECGISENTAVFFTSDNGGLATAGSSPTSNAPLSEGKGWMYEGGVREPLIVRWNKIAKPGSACSVPVTSTDFYPTILEMANLPMLPGQHIDGVSLVDLFKGGNTIARDAIYWHYPHYGNQGGTPGSSMRMGGYKLIEFFEDDRLELYDLKNDLEETHDISGENRELTEKMYAMLKNWQVEVQAKFPAVNFEYCENGSGV
ncbi:MAG: sulfatase [Oscillospiraceae bacterium]|nr:sulfatase [Oscillospiraceae bacterium]